MNNFIQQIRDNWIILSFIVMLIVSWTNQNSRMAAAEADIQNLSQVVSQINTININVAVIQQQLTDINKKLDKIAN